MKSKPIPEAKLEFIGGAGTVTGSKTLLHAGKETIMVDCGLFQGPRRLRELNWQQYPRISETDMIVLTHAHIDHSGYLPRIVKDGYRGPVYCSAATAALCKIMLLDAAYLQEEDAGYAVKTRHSRHTNPLPLFTREDAHRALDLFQVLEDDEWHSLSDQVALRFARSGHILGSRFVQFSFHDTYHRFVCTFSGDIGSGRSSVLKGPVSIADSDYVVLESTYGNRIHEAEDALPQLEDLIIRLWQQKGVMVIPSFAVGRTQEILFLINQLKSHKMIPSIPVYLDSPMATEATSIYKSFPEELRLVEGQNLRVRPPDLTGFHRVQSADDSMLLCMKDGPFIVISAAGMLTGGRVLHHLKNRLSDPKNMVVFCGYQAEETKGRLLQNGIDSLRIHHKSVPVEAEIHSIQSLSAHADQAGLVAWLEKIRGVRQVFLNHGEPEQCEALRQRIRKDLGYGAVIAASDTSYPLSFRKNGFKRDLPL